MSGTHMRARLKADELILRCFAEQDPQDGTWFAMCLDLNLYARGDSYAEVRRKLHDVIVAYLKDAIVGAERDHVGDLIPRRAPLYFWFRYACIWCRSKLHQLTTARRFKETLPLVPAV